MDNNLIKDEKEEIQKSIEANPETQPVSFSSRKKLFWLGLIIAIINPIFAGIVLGAAFLNERELKKEGQIILILSIVWGIISIYLIDFFIFKYRS